MEESSQSQKYLWESLLVSGGVLLGTIPIFSALLRNLGISSVEQVIIRIVITGIIGIALICFFVLFFGSNDFIFNKLFQRTVILQGIFLTLAILVYLSSISLGTPVGEAALLIQIHPVITFILAYLFLKESITKTKILSLMLAFLGITFILRPWDLESFFSSFMGDFLAIVNGVFYSIYIIIGRSFFKTGIGKSMHPLVSVSWVLFWSFLAGVPLLIAVTYLPVPNSIIKFDINSIIGLDVLILGFGMAFFGSFLPYLFIMISTKFVESSKAAILLLGEPLGAVILGSAVLGENITFSYIIGGLVLLIAIVLIMQSNESLTATPQKVVN